MSDDSRILITGADGLLGQRFTHLCKQLSEQRSEHVGVFTVYHHTPVGKALIDERSAVGDLADERFATELIERAQPDVIVNLAALTNVELCETESPLAERVNVGIVERLLTLAPKARFIQLSTDYVFDGAKGHYAPTDTPSPISLYGQTKRDAEIAVLQNPNNLVVRTSGIYDWLERDNLFTFFYKRLAAGKETLALSGCHYSPIWANDLAQGLVGLISAQARGVVHYAGNERLTRYELALSIAREFGFDETRLRPVMQEKFNWRARRPADSSLDSSAGYVLAQRQPQSALEVCAKYRKNL